MRIASVGLFALISAFGLFAEDRALLVGIGRYPVYTGWTEIHGDADVDLLVPALKKNGYGDVKTLKNAQATKATIIKELKALASRSKAGDKVYFHFSGHGQPVEDINGDEGSKGFDEGELAWLQLYLKDKEKKIIKNAKQLNHDLIFKL